MFPDQSSQSAGCVLPIKGWFDLHFTFIRRGQIGVPVITFINFTSWTRYSEEPCPLPNNYKSWKENSQTFRQWSVVVGGCPPSFYLGDGQNPPFLKSSSWVTAQTFSCSRRASGSRVRKRGGQVNKKAHAKGNAITLHPLGWLMCFLYTQQLASLQAKTLARSTWVSFTPFYPFSEGPGGLHHPFLLCITTNHSILQGILLSHKSSMRWKGQESKNVLLLA